MSAFATRSQIGQRASTGLYASNLGNQLAFKGSAFLNGSNGAQFDDDAICTDFGQLLPAQPVASAVVSGVASPLVLGEANIKRRTVSILPDVDVHTVLLIKDR